MERGERRVESRLTRQGVLRSPLSVLHSPFSTLRSPLSTHDSVAVDIGVFGVELVDLLLVVGDEETLVGEHLCGVEVAEVEEREGGEDVVVGLVAILPFEVQHLEEVAQLVLPQAGPHEADVLQGVEIARAEPFEVQLGAAAAQVVEEDLVVVAHVVAHEGVPLAVVHEEAQPLGTGVAAAVAVDLQHGVGVAADGLG